MHASAHPGASPSAVRPCVWSMHASAHPGASPGAVRPCVWSVPRGAVGVAVSRLASPRSHLRYRILCAPVEPPSCITPRRLHHSHCALAHTTTRTPTPQCPAVDRARGAHCAPLRHVCRLSRRCSRWNTIRSRSDRNVPGAARSGARGGGGGARGEPPDASLASGPRQT